MRVFLSCLSLMVGLCVSSFPFEAYATKPTAHSSTNPSETRMPSTGEIKKAFESGSAVVLDVREPEELKDGFLKGAINMPMSKIDADDPQFKSFLSQLPKDKEVWLYCRSGRRSGLVAEKLASQGYKVRNIGGFENLKSAGLATEKR